MSDRPSIPKTNRSLDGLDDLIGQSIGQKASYDQMYGPAPLTRRPSERVTEFERLQVKVASDVALAAKYEALKSKKSPGEIVELALRQYLNLPPNS